MSESNWVNASTKIEALATKKDQILDKVAVELADVLLKKQGRVTDGDKNQILTIIKDFSSEDKNKILAAVIIMVAKGSTSTSTGGDLFSKRGWN